MRPHNCLFQAALVWRLVSGTVVSRFDARSAANCHVLPTDELWPSVDAWAALNTTVNGRLVASSPLGSPCHDPNFDAAACKVVQQQWPRPEFHLSSSSSVMESFFANQSCDPFTPRNWTCTLGNYVSYAVNVSTPADVAATIKFAKQHNIRLVIRNTGHDFLGRSTGAGGLAIWVHGLSQTDIVQWADEHYTGPALRAGAGVLGAQAVEAAGAQGLAVVTGECPTVGLAGGFTQGGGHSALSTSFGMAADQVLEYEVVVADGRILKASPTCNADLYWALSGGGGGNYAVVTAITVRAYPSASVGGGQLAISLQYTNQSSFDAAVSQFHALLPDMVAAGCSLSYILTNSILQVGSITAFNSTGDFVRNNIMSRFIQVLADLGIPSQSSFTTLSYLDHYNTYMGPLPNGHLTVNAYQFGGRLIPQGVVANNNSALQSVIKETTSQGVIVVGTASSWLAPANAPPNAVLPAWRQALIQLQLLTPWDATNWDKMTAQRAAITDVFVPWFEAITPGSGTYMNEADFNQPNWQEAFYGTNYDRLLAEKQKWDPENVFYTLKGVGSDSWAVGNDGRMCRA